MIERPVSGNPPAFRGNCDCGRWMIVPPVPKAHPLFCDCGRSYWYDADEKLFECHEHSLIFLDIDGVLNNTASLMSYGWGASPACVEQLNSITERTGAVIVISSARRRGGLEWLMPHLVAWGITGKVVDVTPDLSQCDGGIWRAVQRGEEIAEWLERNKRRGTPMVILDDEADMAHLAPFLVKTDYETGLTEHHALLAKESLLRQMGKF